MNDRRTLALAAVVVAVCAAAVFLGVQNDQPAPRRPTAAARLKDPAYAGLYHVTATDPAGNAQQTTFACGTPITKNGYLAYRSATDACLAALAVQFDYLERGERPRLDCDAFKQVTHAGWRYVITGEPRNDDAERYVPFHQALTVKTKCDEALWQEMQALLPEA